ncbi:MAG: cell division protein ZapA, partial [Gallionellaceae bacterium]|nr:cell division protein ZapA [Gallionellaceae bacterium]
MSGKKVNALDVKILDRDFRVACSDDEKPELLQAVAYLDKKMREISDAGKVVSIEKIAVMAALNITHEFLATKLGGGFDMGDYKSRM